MSAQKRKEKKSLDRMYEADYYDIMGASMLNGQRLQFIDQFNQLTMSGRNDYMQHLLDVNDYESRRCLKVCIAVQCKQA